jgi:hypothetical protein
MNLQLIHKGNLDTILVIFHLPNLIFHQIEQEWLNLHMLLHSDGCSKPLTCCRLAKCVRICPPECAPGQCAPAVRALATSWRKHSFLAESFFGGGLVEDHHDMMLAK